ncbi:PP2C family protein-serine/threonine phosphatase [Aeoliella mucimassa]|uniref:PPM-type phosphatase domain-containing protein n=1 Tax=Aeoliella mucimassa TaxID=2527972 RepID=A0A518AJ14_9BACT|nr:protein phosphatase 2C domain-containing protein [Aeoliella mucimassa]QDU54723.1 Putative protein phosphatase 2C-type [Aeoliella mucimassa]
MPADDPKSLEANTFKVIHAARSDLGMRRSNNQDAMAVVEADEATWKKRGHFFMVADGMGAHAAGELASQLAVDNVPHTYHKLSSLTPPAALRQSVHKANKLINDKGQSAAEFNGMGTTCSCLALLPGAALIAHVGDSRVYRLRHGELQQLTFDHSLVWEMAAASDTSDEHVPACIPKNVITRSLGPHAMVNVDLEGPYTIEPGDKFLLCSDGLTGVVDNELLGCLLAVLPPDEAVTTLVDVANLRGGPDNITVVVVEVACQCSPSQEDNGSSLPECPGCQEEEGWLSRLFGWFWRTGSSPRAGHELGGPYGNGPYRHYPMHPEVSARDMGGLCRELSALEHDEESPLARTPKVDWQAFNQVCDEAHSAADTHDAAESIKLYSKAIRKLMSQIRQGDSPSDSAIR